MVRYIKLLKKKKIINKKVARTCNVNWMRTDGDELFRDGRREIL